MKKEYTIRFFLMLLIAGVCFKGRTQQTVHLNNPPVNTEVLLSNRGMTFQMIINKQFKSVPKLGFFGITNLVGEWNNNQVADHMTQAHFTYDLVKGLKIGAGFHLTPVTGIRPSASLIYTKANRDWLFVVNPRIDLAKDANLEGLVLIEYKPKINDTWKLYTRIQSLYGYTTSINKHSRSYLMARAGVSYKEFTFGAGTNIDYYGPIRHNENSFGGFISYLLF